MCTLRFENGWSKASVGVGVRRLGVLECSRQRELCTGRLGKAWYALGTEKRAGAQGQVGDCGSMAAKRGGWQEDGRVTTVESQKDF